MSKEINGTLYGEKIYWKVKANLDDGKTITFWSTARVEKNGHIMHTKCGRDGGGFWKGNTRILQIVISLPEDIVYEKIARMALKYGELEVTGE